MSKYNSNFLEKVILRLDFDDVSLAQLSDYQQKVSDVFDINTAQNGFEGTFNIDVVDGVMSQSKSELSIWELKSTTSPDKKISFSQKWISIEYNNKSYIDSDGLISDVDKYIQTFLEDFDVKIITRIGLRYINQITIPELESPLVWGQYINADLLGSLRFARERKSPLARNFTQHYYNLSSASLTFSHGIWNDDFPNAINANSYILDFDCNSSIPRDVSDVSLRTEIKSYNGIVEEYFEASIQDSLRDIMGAHE